MQQQKNAAWQSQAKPVTWIGVGGVRAPLEQAWLERTKMQTPFLQDKDVRGRRSHIEK